MIAWRQPTAPPEAPDAPYLDLLQRILTEGTPGGPHRHRDAGGVQPSDALHLPKGFPLVTTKKLHLRSIIHELLWLLNGDTKVRYLQETRSACGTNGPTNRAISARSTASSGATGRWRTAN